MRQIQMVRTPSGPLALIRQTAEKLLAEGVISGALDGDLHAADAATVKAAIMASAICDFCSAPGATHYFDVPDFSIGKLPHNYGAGRSTGGWMACDACNELIVADKRKQLTERAVTTMAFPKFSRAALDELLAKFWDGFDARRYAEGAVDAIAEYVDDRRPAEYGPVKLSDRDLRIEGVIRATGLTPAQITAALAGKSLDRDAVEKLRKFTGILEDPRALSTATHRFRSVLDKLADGPRKPLADVRPHWQIALDAKFSAIASLTAFVDGARREIRFDDPTDLADPAAVRAVVKRAELQSTLVEMGFDQDLKYLRAAQAYSFNGETIAAIREAAAGLPVDAPLSSIETPNTGAGWFWFGEPIAVATSTIVSDRVNALLWGWTEGLRGERIFTLTDEIKARLGAEDAERLTALGTKNPSRLVNRGDMPEIEAILHRAGVTRAEFEALTVEEVPEAALFFSAYVVDARGQYVEKDTPAPSTRWHWPLSMSYAEMLDFNGAQWDRDYGAGGQYAQNQNVMGRAETLAAIAELSRFFVMACLWFKQTVPILTREDGHVERHARKRLAREHKLAEPPTVKVVALRKSARVAAGSDAAGGESAGSRAYQCRWVVKGHPRLQACGPGRKDRKLIWIEAHVAGPDDKPLKTRETVYAVVR